MTRNASRQWRNATAASLQEQNYITTSVVSLFALNPFVWPAILLSLLLSLSKLVTRYPVVRTLLYLLAVGWCQLVIGTIRAVTPICFMYVTAWMTRDHLPEYVTHYMPSDGSLYGKLLLLYALVECVFYLVTLRRAARLQRRIRCPPFPNSRRWLTFRRVEEVSHCVQPMAMPKNCVYWKKYKSVRQVASAFQNGREIEGGQVEGEGVPVEGEPDKSIPPSSSSSSSSSSSPPLSPSRPFASSAPGEHPLEFLKGWFYNLPLKEIKHDNLMSFFAESTLGMHLHELTSDQRHELEEIVSYIQLKARRRTSHKNNNDRVSISHPSRPSLSPAVSLRHSRSIARLKEAVKKLTSPKRPSVYSHHYYKNSFYEGEGEGEGPSYNGHQRATKIARISVDLPSPSSSSPSPSPLLSSSSSPSSLSPSPSPSPSHLSSFSTSDDSSSEADVSTPISPCVKQQQITNRRTNRSTPKNAHEHEEKKSIEAQSNNVDHDNDGEEEEEDDDDDDDSWSKHLSLGTLPAGRAADRDPMSLNLAPVQWLHRPLAIYMSVQALGFVAATYMRYLGFTHHTQSRVSYWYRPAHLTREEMMNHTPRADPIVLIHGIGIGAFTYLHMLSTLFQTKNSSTCAQRSMYIVEIPAISMQLGCDDIPSPHEHVACIADMLYRHEMNERVEYRRAQHDLTSDSDSSPSSAAAGDGGPSVGAFFSGPQPSFEEIQRSSRPIKAIFVGHSYGTFVATWVIKNRSDLVAAVFLIDPVCFLVFDPSLIYNFIYRTPFNLVTTIYNYFTSRELGISYALCRHFWWYENILWREEFERIGMSPSELEASLFAERDEGMDSLPYHDLIGIEEKDNENVEGMQPKDEDDANNGDGLGSRSHSDDGMLKSRPHPPPISSSLRPLSETPLCPAISLGPRVFVYLASNDAITPSSSIQAYLRHCQEIEEAKWGVGQAMVRFKVFEGIGHAECLFHSSMKQEIIEAIQTQPSFATMRREIRLQQAMKRAGTPM